MGEAIDFAVLFFLYVAVFRGKWRAKGEDILLVNSTMYIYLSFVLYFTLMPVIISLPFAFNHPYVPMNMVPFIDVLSGKGDFARQVGLNVLMAVPFGFLFPLTSMGSEGNDKFRKTVWFCFLMSLGIELLQPLVNGIRSSDITDIITNVSGGIIGYVLYLLLKPITTPMMKHIRGK